MTTETQSIPNIEIDNKTLVGAVESIDLPVLGLTNINTRIDTGAQTSALHVDHIVVHEDKKHLSFEFHPDFHDIDKTIRCKAEIHARRWVKSSNGERERRYVIKTQAVMNAIEWDIELTLTDRSTMTHLMLLGREALAGQFVVDPGSDFVASTEVNTSK
uniref:ATP-dependent zinc protease family protein n=1 Tax=Ningiella ruwaisensis TaxID=2364274 RepID=UPI00109FBE63|nr:RimK/LysX family protein [Ningiella ruwaisensis]